MKLMSNTKSRFGIALFSVLGVAIASNCGCKQEATNSNAASPGTPNATATQTNSTTNASNPAASAEDARSRRASGQKNDGGAAAVGRPMNPDKFGPPK